MLAIVNTCAVIGLDGQIVEVQTDFNPRAALPSFNLVGLAGYSRPREQGSRPFGDSKQRSALSQQSLRGQSFARGYSQARTVV